MFANCRCLCRALTRLPLRSLSVVLLVGLIRFPSEKSASLLPRECKCVMLQTKGAEKHLGFQYTRFRMTLFHHPVFSMVAQVLPSFILSENVVYCLKKK